MLPADPTYTPAVFPMKSTILVHGLWVAVAAGAFFAGSRWQSGGSAQESGPGRTVSFAGDTGLTPAEQAAVLKSGAVSRDSSIAAFLSRYDLGSGKPLPPEKMRQAMQEALRETDPVKSQMLFTRLLEELTPENAAETLAVIRENAAGFDVMRFMPLMAYQWGTIDAKGAFEAMENGNMDGRMGKPMILAGLASTDPDSAIRWLESQKDLDQWERAMYTQSLVNGMAKSDPDRAMQFALSAEDPADRARSAETLAREKIKGGLDEAYAWAQGLTDPDMKRGAMQAMAEQFSRTDINRAADIARQYSNEEWAQRTLGSVAERMAKDDPAAALQFAAGLQGDARDRAYLEVVQEIASTDPNEALRIAGTLSGDAQSRAYSEAIRQLASKDPQQALTVAASLPENVQTRAYAETIERWVSQDAEAASNFVNRMPEGPARDAATFSMVRQIADDDPISAIAWADTISNDRQRERALIDAARAYYRAEPEAAAAWLTQSGLPPEMQSRVTEERGRGGRGGWGGGPPGGRGPGGPGGGRFFRGGR